MVILSPALRCSARSVSHGSCAGEFCGVGKLSGDTVRPEHTRHRRRLNVVQAEAGPPNEPQQIAGIHGRAGRKNIATPGHAACHSWITKKTSSLPTAGLSTAALLTGFAFPEG
ncbi:hypothetical protein GCM10017688_26140 [Streptomyces ramulosus]